MAEELIGAESAGTLDDGYSICAGTSHANNRDAIVGTGGSTTAAFHYGGFGKISFGATPYFTYRPFLSFDIGASSIPSGATIDSVKLKLQTNSDTSGFVTFTHMGDFHIAKGTHVGFGASTYNDIDGWVSSGTYEGNVTEYGEFTSAASTAYDITLNATAIADVESTIDSGYLKITLIYDGEWVEDYTLTGSGFFLFNGINMASTEDTTPDNRPHIVVTYTGGAAEASGNSIIFGTNF